MVVFLLEREGTVDLGGEVMAGEAGRELPVADPLRKTRDRRFADLIDYALSRLGAERGAVLGAQAELCRALGVSSTMIHRYRNSGVDFNSLKAGTVSQLAKVLGLEIGTVYLWVEEGREAALSYQRRITSKPAAFSPVDLADELSAMLRRYGTVLDSPTPPPPPQLQCHLLMDAVRQKREPAPELFDQFTTMLELQQVLQQVEGGGLSDLEPEQWEAFSKLLGRSVDSLQAEFLA